MQATSEKVERMDSFSQPTTMKEAARVILEAQGGPMRATDITEIALAKGMIRSSGRTPAATMQAQLSVAAKNGQEFVRTQPGTYGLITRDAKGTLATTGTTEGSDQPEEQDEKKSGLLNKMWGSAE